MEAKITWSKTSRQNRQRFLRIWTVVDCGGRLDYAKYGRVLLATCGVWGEVGRAERYEYEAVA